ncbi:hypothetical protein MTR_3g013660 [Medicago truncatula]|uniref:ATP-dependent RNA helicase SUV3 DEXQ-box helicase domain-containing protein n=1 Tax=Medicago truncatula TaxID=3880 RepID=G7IYM2_MEDTR|nr:hypothetical protein MTR_3g013660 [Medicago truncatula]
MDLYYSPKFFVKYSRKITSSGRTDCGCTLICKVLLGFEFCVGDVKTLAANLHTKTESKKLASNFFFLQYSHNSKTHTNSSQLIQTHNNITDNQHQHHSKTNPPSATHHRSTKADPDGTTTIDAIFHRTGPFPTSVQRTESEPNQKGQQRTGFIQSGRIVPCHGTDPGSIPGWCIFEGAMMIISVVFGNITSPETLDENNAKKRNCCSPLRLLTMKVFDEVNESYDMTIVDEIQMMADSYSGYACTRVLIGLKDDELHLYTEDELCEQKLYERFKQLVVEAKTLLGNVYLPPEIRSQQVNLFNDQSTSVTKFLLFQQIAGSDRIYKIANPLEKIEGLSLENRFNLYLQQCSVRRSQLPGNMSMGMLKCSVQNDSGLLDLRVGIEYYRHIFGYQAILMRKTFYMQRKMRQWLQTLHLLGQSLVKAGWKPEARNRGKPKAGKK